MKRETNGKGAEMKPIPPETNDVSGAVVTAAFRVHSTLGPGLLESVYETCLVHELKKQGHEVAQQVAVPIEYDGILIEGGLRLDLTVNAQVVVELKAVEKLLPVHEAQLLTYLRLTGCRVGLLINFNVPSLKDGIRRMVL